MKRTTFIAAIVCALAIPAIASAVPPGDDYKNERKAKRAKFIKKMKQHRAKMLRTKIGLSEAKAARVERVMDKFHVKKRELKKEMRANHQALRQLLKSDSQDQRAYGVAVDGIVASRAQLAKLHDKQIAALRRVLTPKEQAKMLIAMHKMKRRFRHRMHKRWRKHKRGKRRGAFGDGPDADGPPPGDFGPRGDGPPLAQPE